MTDEIFWEIKPQSTSYRFLSRWHKEYKRHKRLTQFPEERWYYHADVAKDFCSYYRHVFLTIIKVFLFAYGAFICLPVGIGQAIYCSMTGNTPNLPFDHWYFNFSFGLTTILGWFELVFLIGIPIAFCLVWTWENVIMAGVENTIAKIAAMVPDKKTKKQSLIRAWLEMKKHKFCKMVKYTEE